MQFLAPGGVKIAAHHTLPQVVDSEWVQTNQHAGAFFHRARLPALADASQSALRFDDYHIRRLVDHRLALLATRIAWCREVVNGLDLVFGKCGLRCPCDRK